MGALRNPPPVELAGHPVTAVDDAAAGIRRTAAGHETKLDLARADVLVWWAGERTRVVVRPSGTEPKLKVSLEVVRPVGEREDVPAAKQSPASALGCLRRDVRALLESR
jgi:phosphomannomutase